MKTFSKFVLSSLLWGICSPALSFLLMSTSVSAEGASPSKAVKQKLDRRLLMDSSGKVAGEGKGFMELDPEIIHVGKRPAGLEDSRLPRDRYNLIDWVKLQELGIIKPRPSPLPMEDEKEEILDANVLFESKGEFTPDVIFPHDVHTWWLKCEVCHDTKAGPLFNPKLGTNMVLMVDIVRGKFCGRCHGSVSFPLSDCKRCHNRAKGAPQDDTLLIRKIDY